MAGASIAGACYFAVVFAAGFVLGALRQTVLVPAAGHLVAVAMELPVILGISWIAAGVIVRRIRIFGMAQRLAMGLLAFVLLQGAELALGVVAFGQTAGSYLASLGSAAGLLGLAGQVAFAFMPLAVKPPISKHPHA